MELDIGIPFPYFISFSFMTISGPILNSQLLKLELVGMRYYIFVLLFLFMACEKDTSTDNPNISNVETPITSDGTSGATSGGGTPSTTDTPTYTSQFMTLINNHRKSIGLKTLVLNLDLVDIVTDHSEDMATGAVPFGHTGFSTRCTNSRAVLGGGNWCGENVAMGQKTPQAAFSSWMNSPGHRANIEQSRATHTGFGYAKSSGGAYYWTQIFIEYK